MHFSILVQGGLSTKIHAVCDALVIHSILLIYLTLGQDHDLQGADTLLPTVCECGQF